MFFFTTDFFVLESAVNYNMGKMASLFTHTIYYYNRMICINRKFLQKKKLFL